MRQFARHWPRSFLSRFSAFVKPHPFLIESQRAVADNRSLQSLQRLLGVPKTVANSETKKSQRLRSFPSLMFHRDGYILVCLGTRCVLLIISMSSIRKTLHGKELKVDRVKARSQKEVPVAFCSRVDARSKPSIPSKVLKTWSSLPIRSLPVRKQDTESLSCPVIWCTSPVSARSLYYADWYRSRGYRVIEIDFGPDYLEGHGDLLWHPDRSRIYAGYGFRSTRGGVEKFAAAMSEMSLPVVPLPLIDSYRYHLDTCLVPLNNAAALIFAGAFPAEAQASLT